MPTEFKLSNFYGWCKRWWWWWGGRRSWWCCACPPPPSCRVACAGGGISGSAAGALLLLLLGAPHSTSSRRIAQLPGQSTPARHKQVTVIPKSQNGESILASIPRITLLNCNPSLPTSIGPILVVKFRRKVLKFCIFLPELPALRCAPREGKVEVRATPSRQKIFPKISFLTNFDQQVHSKLLNFFPSRLKYCLYYC